jgi:formate hydrogenlyase subunit 4
MIESVLLWVFAVLTAPLFAGIIFKVKAFFGGRKGSPVLINYYTLIKLFKKGSVYSTSTTYIFRLGPLVIIGIGSHGAAFFAHCRICARPEL